MKKDKIKEPKKLVLPKRFSKAYTEKQLNSKIGKHVYIPKDKEFILSLFVKTDKTDKKGNPLYEIPESTELIKKEYRHLKLIDKEIKSHKGRVKWLPLAAAVSLLVLIGIGFVSCKNIIIKKVLVETFETLFGARCDIAGVNLKLLDASFRIDSLQVANKRKPMKNLFQIDSIVLDFNLTQLLCKRVISDEISINGIRINTDRKYSGDLRGKRAAQRKARDEKLKDSPAFVQEAAKRTDDAINHVTSSVAALINEYNPESVLKHIQNELKTQKAAESAAACAKELKEKYLAKPKEYEEKVSQAKKMYEKAAAINLQEARKDPVKLKQAVDTITEAYNYAEKLKKETEAEVKDIKADAVTVKNTAANVTDAVLSDKKLITDQINKYKNINLEAGQRFITGTLDTAIYKLLGEYYPYYEKLRQSLEEQKGKPKEPKKEKSTVARRAKGRNVYYRKNPPNLWFKKLEANGPEFKIAAHNISDNMDVAGVPASGELSFTLLDLKHNANVTVDTRSWSKEPLAKINYNLDGLPLKLTSKDYKDMPGIPCLNAKSNYDAVLDIYADDGFNLTGTGTFNGVDIRANSFEPLFIYKLYQDTLSGITDMMVSAQIGYRKSKGLNLKLESDMDKKFLDSLNRQLSSRLIEIKERIKTEAFAKINEYSDDAFGEINSFEDIQKKLTEHADYAKNLTNQLEAKKKEAENYVQGKVNETVDKAKEDVKDKANETGKKLLKGLLN
ncbi:MAG: hypothetical protein IKX23_09315 [Treponema sp.]|nr:hypothetical protein [Treponema sp.]